MPAPDRSARVSSARPAPVRRLLPLLLLSGCLGAAGPAFGYAVGHRQLSFVDPSRFDRVIATEVYYPAAIAGENVPLAAGAFPVVGFGHGYLVPWSAYGFVWNALVPEGYIVALPRTESGLLPNHGAFGRDLAFVVSALRAEGRNPASPFFGGVAATAAVMGHSMGGGCSVLAAAADPTITALANLAAAETGPSAIAAAVAVTAPALVFSASLDCVAPPAEHQLPIYSALASACKTYVSVTGGSHCQFADPGASSCGLGEIGCPAPTISGAAQQAVVVRLLLPWLAFTLEGDVAAWADFQNLRAGDPAVTSEQQCSLVGVGEEARAKGAPELRCVPNPARGGTRIRFRPSGPGPARLEIFDPAGRRVRTLVAGDVAAGEQTVIWDGRAADGRRAAAGVYLVKLSAAGRTAARRLVVIE
jgi:predicted dienelactone hydrolase